ncbi:hypothetical protein VZT92_021358 [Zoarces viviparus]|uniref:Uncharacterized protein n=1 Tax=Zoarces viviparus TaxID=48416 RepID=A0AAW1ECI4_ZOAVI
MPEAVHLGDLLRIWGTGPSLGANPFQGALPFTKKRELSRGSRQLLRDRLRCRTGRLAAPISATPDSGI